MDFTTTNEYLDVRSLKEVLQQLPEGAANDALFISSVFYDLIVLNKSALSLKARQMDLQKEQLEEIAFTFMTEFIENLRGEQLETYNLMRCFDAAHKEASAEIKAQEAALPTATCTDINNSV